MVVRVTPAHCAPSRRGAARRVSGIVAGGLLLVLAACSSSPDVKPADTSPVNPKWYGYGAVPASQQGATIFGENSNLGTFLGLSGRPSAAAPNATGVGVNTYLWRASLDTISFMPLASADPFGGVIITDWYSPPGSSNERFKINVFILDQQLHAAGIRTTVFRQTRDPKTGAWVDAPVDAKTAQNLEDGILVRARQLRVASAANAQP